MPSDELQVLVSARAEIARRGLHKGEPWLGARGGEPLDDAPCCMLWALHIVCDDARLRNEVSDCLRAVIRPGARYRSASIAEFNDSIATTLQDVLRVFDTAIGTTLQRRMTK